MAVTYFEREVGDIDFTFYLMLAEEINTHKMFFKRLYFGSVLIFRESYVFNC